MTNIFEVVDEVAVDLDSGTLTVTGSSAGDADKVRAAVEEAGYQLAAL